MRARLVAPALVLALTLGIVSATDMPAKPGAKAPAKSADAGAPVANPAPANPIAPKPGPPPGVGDPFRAFTAPDLNGHIVDVPALVKGKVALVTFWASWCKPCVEEIPKLKDVSDRFRHQGLVVVGVGLQEGGDTAFKQRQMAAKMLMPYSLVFDEQKQYETAYALQALPLNILVGADGKVLFKDVQLPEDLGARIEALLKDAPRATGGGQ